MSKTHADAYSSGPTDTTEVARLKRLASAYNPDYDNEADRLRALGDKLPPSTRTSLGHHYAAKAAHDELESKGL